MRLLVTDSGLGGLAVVAELERRARRAAVGLEIDFVSALAETGRGYNTLGSRQRQAEVFDAALAGMLRRFAADRLLVACNTLSVLLDDCPALHRATLPVLGIVGVGIEGLVEAMAGDVDAAVALFGTPITVEAQAHRAGLMARGLAGERIVSIACPGLASRIEREGRSAAVAAEIARFAAAAVAAAGRGRPLVAALCCSHYGFCADDFEAALAAAGAGAVTLVDPNRAMADAVLGEHVEGVLPPTPARRGRAPIVRVVSRAIPLDEEIAAIAGLLDPISPPTAAALRRYELCRDLFGFREDEPAAIRPAGRIPIEKAAPTS